MSVLGAAKERAYERVSISVGLLISHPAALVHQKRCHVAEQIPALMDESNLLPTQRALLLLPLQKVLRKIPLHSQFLKKKQMLFMFAMLHTQGLCFSETSLLGLDGIVQNHY